MSEKQLNERKYSLQVTEKHLHIIQAAVDLYCFLLLGKFENPLWHIFISRDIDHDEFEAACRRLKEVVFPELHRDANYGVGWKEGDSRQNNSQIAYEVEAMIRHELWKRSEPPHSCGVNASEPLHYSTEELIKLDEIKK